MELTPLYFITKSISPTSISWVYCHNLIINCLFESNIIIIIKSYSHSKLYSITIITICTEVVKISELGVSMQDTPFPMGLGFQDTASLIASGIQLMLHLGS